FLPRPGEGALQGPILPSPLGNRYSPFHTKTVSTSRAGRPAKMRERLTGSKPVHSDIHHLGATMIPGI
ncbi:MAG: hypothetical protein OXH63_12095, partial [Gemmatimonadetes bacterium]|nr:hypothetical protein [Gemmatimonadota bacterium]